MGSRTIVVAGARFRDGGVGFYLLTDQSTPAHAASGEALLDYKCSVALKR
jgi:hypothetical protein